VTDGNKGHRQRLKERFLLGESDALDDEALLELLLTYAIPQKDVQPLARGLLDSFGGLDQAFAADYDALRAIDGIGEHAAVLLRLIGYIGAEHPSVPRALVAGSVERSPRCPPVPGPRGRTTGTGETPALPGEQRGERPALPGTETSWRAVEPYNANNASKAGLFAETELALLTYGRLGDLAATLSEMRDGALPQRSRATRVAITRTIQERLTAWGPPAWVCRDLVACAREGRTADLRLLLLLHTVRQDPFLYDVLQGVVWLRWREGRTAIGRVDVQRFLDAAGSAHLEIERWSLATREKLAGNALTIPRDYGLLQGARGGAVKHIVEPVISPRAAAHLGRLLAAEGFPIEEAPNHPDWRIWLVDAPRARALLASGSADVLPAPAAQRGERPW